MGLINIASGNSLWRGFDYFQKKKVVSYKQLSDFEYEGVISGSNHEYHVFMDALHPRKSTCDCPFAKGRRVICKHIVALYFTVFPDESVRILKEAEEAEKEYQKYEEERGKKFRSFVYKTSKKEPQETVFELLNDLPEWEYDRFVRDKIGM